MERENVNELLNKAKEFVDTEIRPNARQFEIQGFVPRAVINKLANLQFLGAPFPEKYGGLGLDPVSYGLLGHEIGKGCASTRAILTVHTSLVGETIARWGNEDQKSKYLPAMAKAEKIGAFALTEPEIGTNAQGVQTNYHQDGKNFIINGKKKWITYSGLADFFLVVASNEGKVTTFLVDKESEGVTVNRMEGLLGTRAAYVSEIGFENVVVPKENMLGKLGGGFTFIVNTALDFGRYNVAWAGLSLVEAAVEEMVTYSRKRSQFDEKLFKNQLIREMIANALTKLHTGKALLMNVGRLRQENHEDAVMETTIAKYYTSKVAMEVAIDAVQLHGGNGCYNQYPVERLFREAKILEIIEGTSQIQQELISRYGLKRYYKRS